MLNTLINELEHYAKKLGHTLDKDFHHFQPITPQAPDSCGWHYFKCIKCQSYLDFNYQLNTKQLVDFTVNTISVRCSSISKSKDPYIYCNKYRVLL